MAIVGRRLGLLVVALLASITVGGCANFSYTAVVTNKTALPLLLSVPLDPDVTTGLRSVVRVEPGAEGQSVAWWGELDRDIDVLDTACHKIASSPAAAGTLSAEGLPGLTGSVVGYSLVSQVRGRVKNIDWVYDCGGVILEGAGPDPTPVTPFIPSSGVVPDNTMRLSVSNETTIPIGLIVDDKIVATLAPNTQQELPAWALPKLPWRASAISATGSTLVTLTVKSGDVDVTPQAQKGVGARVDLSCGRIEVWSGPPLLGPTAGAGALGDCG